MIRHSSPLPSDLGLLNMPLSSSFMQPCTPATRGETEGKISSLSDEALLNRLGGERDEERRREFIGHLFERHHRRIALLCYRLTGDRESGLDLSQEVMTKAYCNLGSFRGDSKFSTWLYSIARNHCKNALRATHKERHLTQPLDEIVEGDICVEPDIDHAIDMERMKRLLCERLEPIELLVLTLHYGEELTLAAITRLLGLTNLSGAKAYSVSARRKFKAAVARMKAQQANLAWQAAWSSSQKSDILRTGTGPLRHRGRILQLGSCYRSSLPSGARLDQLSALLGGNRSTNGRVYNSRKQSLSLAQTETVGPLFAIGEQPR